MLDALDYPQFATALTALIAACGIVRTILENSEMSESLGTALPAMMARVRDEVIPAYASIGPSGGLAIAMMRAELDTATKALAEGDIVQMLRSYEELKGFKL